MTALKKEGKTILFTFKLPLHFLCFPKLDKIYNVSGKSTKPFHLAPYNFDLVHYVTPRDVKCLLYSHKIYSGINPHVYSRCLYKVVRFLVLNVDDSLNVENNVGILSNCQDLVIQTSLI